MPYAPWGDRARWEFAGLDASWWMGPQALSITLLCRRGSRLGWCRRVAGIVLAGKTGDQILDLPDRLMDCLGCGISAAQHVGAEGN